MSPGRVSSNSSYGGNSRYQPYGGGRGGRGGYSSYGGGRSSGSRGFSNDPSFEYQEFPSFDKLEPFKKDFYVESQESKNQSQEEIRAFRKEHGMNLTGNDIPNPILSFETCQFPSAIKNMLTSAGFNKPTPIQSQGWPMALSGKNVVGIAQTGSGKTLSFILPAIMHILGNPPIQRGQGPVVLVLAPTRELACQIAVVAEEYGNVMGIKTAVLYGGASKGKQIGELSRTPQLVIATPGRLLDLIKMGKTSLLGVSYLVLDEADRMLDMGFEKDLRSILGQIRPDRQMLMWSATWPRSVQNLARDFLAEHIKVQIGSTELKANPNIKQVVKVMDDSEKMGALSKLLVEIWDSIGGEESKREMDRTIIFVNKKYACENIAQELWNQKWDCITIHGDKSQQERDQALNLFKRGDCPILIATDVAARGLDVSGLKHVINYDFPNGVEDFVHRIGRTARGSVKEGNAYTFFTRNKQDRNNASDLVNLMKDAGQEVPSELQDLVVFKRGAGGGGYRGGNSYGGRGGSRYGGNSYGGNRSYGGGNSYGGNRGGRW